MNHDLRRLGPTMNRKRVIFWMTLAVFVLLGWLMLTIFGGLPPWPVTLWFVASHVFFCMVVMRVQPFKGPYTTPLVDGRDRPWAP
ncbi:MAG: hypothetical protein FJX59_04890 [Alphaproteobacteria bacterium]|nr:hypothetical protein [Alphaproteobacteria bacterium]